MCFYFHLSYSKSPMVMFMPKVANNIFFVFVLGGGDGLGLGLGLTQAHQPQYWDQLLSFCCYLSICPHSNYSHGNISTILIRNNIRMRGSM